MDQAVPGVTVLRLVYVYIGRFAQGQFVFS